MSPQPLLNHSVADFLERLAAREPVPGGGSAAALAGALAANLGRMVIAYTVGKPKFAPVEGELRALDERLTRAAELFRELIDEDAAAYEALSAAFKMDKSDPQRSARIAERARLAASVPLESATLAARARGDLERLRAIGNPQLASDSEAATHLARAAQLAAAANVRANLPLLTPDAAATFEQQLAGLPA